ncbi:hypothetical protein [Streptomyces sp. MI02-7b]|uniref:hypothetical protein n=1 Tax=Streptomyces sp. MI02-7b TaxID=462941 RepID=UPI0029ADC61E|nr:hypothetical protein [Streptomyces sp. MI02-7b]MDX3071195.1 hypothetical protein [Streptomyces sp. MI02-7b]
MPYRLASGFLGAFPLAPCLAFATEANTPAAWLATGPAMIGFAALAVRGYRLGVTHEHSRVVIRGYLRTRVIERARITQITDFPAVRWTAGNGRRRWTPLTALMTSPGEMAASRLRKERALKKLRAWARRADVASGRS